MRDKPENYSGDLVAPKLDSGLREALQAILPNGATTEQLNAMVLAFEQAGSINQFIKLESERESTLTERKNSLRQLQRALNRAEDILDGMYGADETLLDQYYYVANIQDRYLLEQFSGPASGFTQQVIRLRKAVEHFHGRLVSPGTGGGRDTTHTDALILIADQFATLFPKTKLSANKRTTFHNLVKLWFKFIGVEIEDPTRQINTALAARP